MSRLLDTSAPHEAVSALTRDSDTISVRSRHTLRAFGNEDEQDDPWSAIPSSTSVTELTRVQRRRLLGRALLQLLILFVVCLVGLGGTLWLALPVIAPEDKASFKIPRSFDDLKALNAVLQHYKTDHFARVLLCWVVVYMFLQAFSIPGSMYMSILAGALFGVHWLYPSCASVWHPAQQSATTSAKPSVSSWSHCPVGRTAWMIGRKNWPNITMHGVVSDRG